MSRAEALVIAPPAPPTHRMLKFSDLWPLSFRGTVLIAAFGFCGLFWWAAFGWWFG